MNEIYIKKKMLRKEILNIRNNIDESQKRTKDAIIKDKFLNSDYYKKSKNIFIYISYGSEIDTKEIIYKALDDGKSVFVPRTEFETKLMDAVKITSLDNMKEDRYGILEPSKEEPCISPDEIDLIVVPGVAFDRTGGRTGYGAGYYDRYFKKISLEKTEKIKKVALAYDFQVIDNVPMNKQDVKIDCIITEKCFIE